MLVKRVIVQNVAAHRLRGAERDRPASTAQMAAICPGQVIYFAADRHHPLMATHRAQGKRCVYVDGDQLVAAQGSVARDTSRCATFR